MAPQNGHFFVRTVAFRFLLYHCHLHFLCFTLPTERKQGKFRFHLKHYTTTCALTSTSLTALINPSYISVQTVRIPRFTRPGMLCKNLRTVSFFLSGNTATTLTSPVADRAVTITTKSLCPFLSAISSSPSNFTRFTSSQLTTLLEPLT